MVRASVFAAVVTFALLFAVPTAAAATWSVDRIERVDAFPGPRLAVNARGEAIAAWSESWGRLQFARSTSDGRFGPPRTIRGARAGYPAVAIAPSGRAVLAWNDRRRDGSRCCIRVRAAILPVHGRPKMKTLSLPGENAERPSVAIGAGGRAAVIWTAGNFAHAAFSGRRGRFGRPCNASRFEYPSLDPRVQALGGGRFLASWIAGDRGTQRLRAARGRPGRCFAPARTLLAPDVGLQGYQFSDWELVSDRRGRQLAVWSSFGEDDPLSAAFRRPGERFDTRQLDTSTFQPDAALGARGAAAVAWIRSSSPDARGVFLALRPPGGGFGDPLALEPPRGGVFVSEVSVALARNGVVAAVWDLTDRLFASVGRVGGSMGPATELGSIGSPGAEVAAGARGRLYAAWDGPGGIHVATLKQP